MENNSINTTILLEPEVSAEKTKEIARFTKKRSKKKRLLIGMAILLVAALLFLQFRPKDTRPMVNTSALAKGELVSRITLNGTIESDNALRVYSTETGLVKNVLVKVGDRVEEGDILCELDTKDIERDIKIQQTSISNAAQKAALSLSSSQIQYQNLLDDLQTDKYAELISAEQALNYAQRDYTDARHELDDHKDEQEYADEVVNGLERQMNLARVALSRAKKDYNNAEKAGEGVEEALIALQEAETAYDQAYAAWEDANDEYGDVVTRYTKDYRLARLKYNDALENKETIERAATRRLAELKNAIELDVINSDMTAQTLQLEKLQNSLNNAKVKAPISGTVTAVYALEGMPGNGLLFVVEDTEQLIVKTSVREYDIAAIETGMAAVIKSDATGEQEFNGSVLRISPAAAKSANGSTETGSTSAVTFDTDVSLLSKDSALRIGMNVRLNIILEQKSDVFSVPYDAVTTDDTGSKVIYLAQADEKGEYYVHVVPVETDMETDFYIEVASETLNEGALIITDPAGVKDGDAIRLLNETAG